MKQFDRWSFSALDTYRSCPLRAYFRYVERIPEPGNKYSNRGNEIHDELQKVVQDGAPVPDYAAHFKPLLEQMQQSDVTCEQMMMFDSNWKPTTDRSNVWLMVKQDLVTLAPGEFVLTVDYKSGKKFGNEVKHMAQMTLYSVAAWIHYPGLKEYIAELWYIDQKSITTKSYTAPILEMARARLDTEVAKMFDDKTFRPRPSAMNCKYCPYGPKGTGHCPVGV